MATFVLVHGAWHGGWCWENLSPLLERRGHTAIAPDLPGMGADRTPLQEVTLDLWTAAICDLIEPCREPVVLVGHSRGGIVISAVAERMPQRIASLVYLAAFLVPDGKSLNDIVAMGPPTAAATDAFVVSGDGVSVTIAPGKTPELFYNTTSEPVRRKAAERLTAEPVASLVTPIRTSPQRFGTVRRAYVECLRDNAIAIDVQRIMQQELPCDPVLTFDTDHSPFYSAPERLADALDRIAG
jgi:pimeloyl-ACP methyl ester carboxylesterase